MAGAWGSSLTTSDGANGWPGWMTLLRSRARPPDRWPEEPPPRNPRSASRAYILPVVALSRPVLDAECGQ